MAFSLGEERELREAAFAFLDQRQSERPMQLGLVTREDVSDFVFHGERLALRDRNRGIRAPARGLAALSFTTVAVTDPTRRPYEDDPGPDGFLRYKWQGTDPDLGVNVKMRAAMDHRLPLIWFFGVGGGLYQPVYPVWLVDEEPQLHQFVVALAEEDTIAWENKGLLVSLGGRAYAERLTRQRLHQPLFRSRVLLAYGRRCAVCRLARPELLDAAHIRGDAASGEPVVPNGIAMCKIHHAAFDRHLLGLRPTDLRLELRHDLLDEVDGPMLVHGLQAFHGETLRVPSQRRAHPDRLLLEERYGEFRAAG